MKKNKLKISSLIMAGVITSVLVGNTITVSASTNLNIVPNEIYYDDEMYYEETIVTDKFIDTNLVNSTNITPFNNYGESQVTTNLTTYKTIYVTPTEQPTYGYKGSKSATAPDYAFFFSTKGASYKFTVQIDYKNVQITAETGKATQKGSGVSYAIPVSQVNSYKLRFIKDYTIKTKKIDVYKYGVYQYTYYEHNPGYSLGRSWYAV